MPSSRERLAAAYARRNAAMAELAKNRKDKMSADAIDKEQNWGGDVFKGGAMGASMGGPVGGIIGAVLGGAKSSIENYQTRRAAGQSGSRSFWKSAQDAVNPAHMFPVSFEESANAGASLKSSLSADRDARADQRETRETKLNALMGDQGEGLAVEGFSTVEQNEAAQQAKLEGQLEGGAVDLDYNYGEDTDLEPAAASDVYGTENLKMRKKGSPNG